MTNREIIDEIERYLATPEYHKIKALYNLYEGDNPGILKQGESRKRRNKTPNHVIPTAYYSTVVDTMAGYMFQDVQYNAEDETRQATLDAILEANNIAVQDMQMGIASLAFNKGIEYIYTNDNAEIKISKLSAVNTIIIYSENIEQNPIAAINFKNIGERKYKVLYITAEEERSFTGDNKSIYDEESRPLFFSRLPVVDFKAQVIGKKAPFEVCIPYIDALDFLVSGNANEIDRLVDALLVIGRVLDQEDLNSMDEWKVLQDMKAEDRAEYLVKETSPEFRKYVSELLIREIHKHSHVIDWYASDQGQAADASGKALRTRLFDMDMYSKRIEMAYREGMYKRLQAIGDLADALRMPIGAVRVEFKRTMIDDFLDDAVKLTNVTYLSDITKREILGVDEEKEQERLAEERPAAIEFDDV